MNNNFKKEASKLKYDIEFMKDEKISHLEISQNKTNSFIDNQNNNNTIFKINNDISRISCVSNKSIDSNNLVNIQKNFNKKKEIDCKNYSIIIGTDDIKSDENKLEIFNHDKNEIFTFKGKINGSNPKLFQLKNFLNILTFDSREKNQITLYKIDLKNIINNQNRVSEIKKIINNEITYDFSSVQISNKVFIAGGLYKNKISNKFLLFNLQDKKIIKLSSMNESKYLHSLIHCKISNFIYAIGGVEGKNKLVTNTCEYYDSLVQKWIKIDSLNHPRKGHENLIINNKIYVFGGNNGKKNLSSIEFYDDNEKKWILFKIELSIPRTNFGIFLDSDENKDDIYILAGIITNNENTTCIEKINLKNEKKIVNNLSILFFKSLIKINN